MNNEVLHIEKQDELNNALNILEKKYLIDNSYNIQPNNVYLSKEDYKKHLRFVLLDKVVYVKDQKNIEKLTSVYSALYSVSSTVLLKLVSDGKTCNIYLGIKKGENVISNDFKVLKGALEGNFPGTTFRNEKGLNNTEIIELNKSMFSGVKEITTVLGIPSLKNSEDDEFIQGMENLILGMHGKPFSALFIAEPISANEISVAKNLYENVYSNLSSLKENTFNLGKNKSVSFTNSINESLSETLGSSDSNTESNTENESTTIGESKSSTKGNNTSTTEGKSKTKNKTPWIGKAFWNKIVGYSASSSTGINSSTTKGNSTSNTIGHSSSKTKGSSKTESSTKSKNQSTANTTGTSESEANTFGNSESIQFTKMNKQVSNSLEKLDSQFERLKIGENIGLWSVGSYFSSKEPQNSVIAASLFNGLLRGEDSNVEQFVTRTFYKNDLEFSNVLEAISNYSIPILQIINSNYQNYLSSVVSTKEMAIQFSLPQKSIIGLDVVEVAPFGNNIRTKDDATNISVGKLYNYEKQFDIDFNLDIEKFTGHIFVTGSTGSGKSNATYTILNKLIYNNIKFLVVEPAKGEYKDVFGGRHDVSVYSTNPKYSILLKMNPFSFPEQIHIYEHIDRLIEILNASWPMYAAMPAILKEAVIKTYEAVGWNMIDSINESGEKTFPTFQLLSKILPKLIEESDYSNEMKGNYSGALVTRVNSMCNGLLSLVFTEDEIDSKQLFDENVIVDLSMVASSETKSLLMGILFMKLQEHRMSNGNGHNSRLKHVTVLEEAHNLLKKTSSEQGQEGANLQGKSVEMISNAIAEMRTYGQGFILADQSPGLLDPSAIRNTNTKICLRLPSQDDRELMGKAMILGDDQIMQLAKLETGVAAIYQNDWQETMLCKFDFFKQSNLQKFNKPVIVDYNPLIKFLAKQLVCNRINKALDLVKLQKVIDSKKYQKYNSLSRNIKRRLSEKTKNWDENDISKELYKLLKIKDISSRVDLLVDNKNNSLWIDKFKLQLKQKYKFEDKDDSFKQIVDLSLKQLALIKGIESDYNRIYNYNRN